MDRLKNQRIWLCWNYEMVKGRKTKVPMSADGRPTGTTESYRDTWTDYQTVERVCSAGVCDGVGFVIPKGFFLLDLDHKSTDDPVVRKYMERFSQTYCELSPSGNGLHIYGLVDLEKLPTVMDQDRLKLSPDYNQRKSPLELYIGGLTNRYSTYTGDPVRDVPLADCTDAVMVTLDQDLKKPTPARPSRDSASILDWRPGMETDTEAIEGLRHQRNGAEFTRLFDYGDIATFTSPSEADLALCSHIAFRVGPDADRIDRIFRQSALYRKKWDREDYRTRTINKAIDTYNYYKKPETPTHSASGLDSGVLDWGDEIND